MFRPDVFLRARVEGTQILVSVNWCNGCVFLAGSTVKASIASGSESVNSFTLYPEAGKDGMVAVLVRSNKNTLGFFLLVTWVTEEGGVKPRIELSQEFSPVNPVSILSDVNYGGRLYGSRLTARVGEQWVSTSRYEGARLVTDRDLLCRYAFGTATAEEVLAAAEEQEAEETAREKLTQAQKTIDGQKNMIDYLGQQLAKSQVEYTKSLGNLQKARTLVEEMRKSYQTLATCLPRVARPRWFQCRKFNEVIAGLQAINEGE